MMSVTSCRSDRFTGTMSVPGDKSISHRALILGGCATGETSITGLLEGEDVLATASAMQLLGARIQRGAECWRVTGTGIDGFSEPANALDMGNAGTGARLILGILSTLPFTSFVIGDSSLSSRPMNRVMEPLSRMGATFWTRSGGRLPLAVRGTASPIPIAYELPVPSAQVKSAVLLAGLNTPGETTIHEPQLTRDHTERLMRHFGAEIEVVDLADGGRRIFLRGQSELNGRHVEIPADFSSAAFPLVAALIVPDAHLTLPSVGLNPLRTGLLSCLEEMGANISIRNKRTVAGEPVGDIRVASASLRGIRVPAGRAPSMIDEFPILAIAAAAAKGSTELSGLAELRVKESDRLHAMANGLRACGVLLEEGNDWLTIHGTGAPPTGGAHIAVNLDHRVAMAFLVLGMTSVNPVQIDNATPINTSFPNFIASMVAMGARFSEPAVA